MKEKASFSVEAALLFPLLFLLWMCVLYCAFSLYAQLVGQAAASRTYAGAKQLMTQTGLSLSLERYDVSEKNLGVYTERTTTVEVSHRMWGTHSHAAQRTRKHFGNASFRTKVDFLTSIGEEIPVVDDLVMKWREHLRILKESMSA